MLPDYSRLLAGRRQVGLGEGGGQVCRYTLWTASNHTSDWLKGARSNAKKTTISVQIAPRAAVHRYGFEAWSTSAARGRRALMWPEKWGEVALVR